MNIVIDANILIAALLKDSKMRELIVNSLHKLLVPEVHFQEIEEHKAELLEKSGLNEEEFDILLMKLSNYFTIAKSDSVLSFIEEAENLMGSIDKDDVPVIATSLAYKNCPIWSDDKHFQQQKKIKVWKTEEIIKTIEKSD